MSAPQQSVAVDGYWPSWELFGDAILTGLLLAAVLPCLGVLLLLRRQVFVAAAIGQAANVGIALAMTLGVLAADGHGHGADGVLAPCCGAAAAMLATFAALRTPVGGEGSEARSAFVFLVGGALSLLLLANAPHGLQSLQRLFLSSLLAVSARDVWLAAAAAILTGGWLCWQPRMLLHWAIDAESAAVHGLPVRRFEIAAAILVGAVLGQAILATGLLFTFGAVVLPVLAARDLAGSLRGVLVLAPVLGVASMLLGFSLAHRHDLPPAQVAVAVAGIAAAAARLRRFC